MGDQLSRKERENLVVQLEQAKADTEVPAKPEVEDDGIVDTVVTDRMLSRVFTFAGFPVLFGLLLFPCFWYLKVCHNKPIAADLVIDTKDREQSLPQPVTPILHERGCADMQVVKDIDLPMGTVFVTQSIVFGAGLLGITYGVTSASWDPARQGSRLGWNEFRANLAAIMGKVDTQ